MDHLYLPLVVAQPPPGAGPEDIYLNEGETARILRCSGRTLQRARRSGDGPPFIRVGERRLVYRLADVRAWARAQRGAA
jgi:hypothetical protein